MVKSAVKKSMIMNFSTPPSSEDLQCLVEDICEALPADISEYSKDLEIVVEDFADVGLLSDLDLEDEFELSVFYSGGDASTNIIQKQSDSDVTLTIFRRPVLDMWCETGEDLGVLLQHLIVTEIAESHGYTESDIEDMLSNADSTSFAA